MYVVIFLFVFQFILHVNLLLLKAFYNLWDCRIVAVALAVLFVVKFFFSPLSSHFEECFFHLSGKFICKLAIWFLENTWSALRTHEQTL